MNDQATSWKDRVLAGRPIEAPRSGELVITGSQLRELLLLERITSAGLVIRGSDRVIIRGDSPLEGAIDLSYLAGREGGPLPPLVLEQCRLHGPLRLTGSHFAFLSLEGCKFSRIDGDHCRIDNHCRLINLRPIDGSDPDAVAQIRMVAARIDGTADLRNSQLRAPRGRPGTPPRSRADRYALSFASAKIAGRLLLDENFEALGGVSLYQATIRSSISVRTAKLESRLLGTPALDAQELRVAGGFLWANPPPLDVTGPSDWHVAGEIVLRHAEIGGDCSFEHCRWAGTGAVSLRVGHLVDHICGGLDLRFARIAGQLAICAGCHVAQGNAPPSRRKEEGISGIFGPSLDGWKANFGKGVRIECDAVFAGPVLLNGTEIGHELIFRGEVDIPMPRVALPSVPEALDLSGARVRGLVRIWGMFSGCVRIHGATVDGTMELQELTFDCPPLATGDPDQDLTRGLATLLDLSAVRITGALHIGNVGLAAARQRTPTEEMHKQVIGGKVRAIRAHPIEDGRLEEFILEDGIHATVFDGPRGPELFEGTHEQFLDLSPHALPLTSPEEARSFIDLYFRTAAGELGPSGAASIGVAEPQRSGWLVRACQYPYAGRWYETDVCIDAGGEVWFEGDRPIARAVVSGAEALERIGPFSRVQPGEPPLDQKPADPSHLARFRTAVSRYFANRRERPLLIDLRGVDCRSFNDMQGRAWEWLGPQRHWRLLLDGISFVQFEDIDPKSRSRRQPNSLAAPRPELSVAPESARRTRQRRIKMLLTFVGGNPIRGWRGIKVAAASPNYSPHPFQTFAHAYAQGGNHFLAVEIVKVQRRLQWTRAALDIQESIGRRRRRIFRLTAGYAAVLFAAVFVAGTWRGVAPGATALLSAGAALGLWLLSVILALGWPLILVTVGRLFDFCFGFGLKPRRALVTLGLCLVGGIIAVNAFDELVPVPRSAPVEQLNTTRVATAVEGCSTVGDTFADRSIYAFDVFVPLIDIRQECAFVIEEGAWHLRVLKAFYATLGWLVVSLTLLTFSGVLRRDIEH